MRSGSRYRRSSSAPGFDVHRARNSRIGTREQEPQNDDLFKLARPGSALRPPLGPVWGQGTGSAWPANRDPARRDPWLGGTKRLGKEHPGHGNSWTPRQEVRTAGRHDPVSGCRPLATFGARIADATWARRFAGLAKPALVAESRAQNPNPAQGSMAGPRVGHQRGLC